MRSPSSFFLVVVTLKPSDPNSEVFSSNILCRSELSAYEFVNFWRRRTDFYTVLDYKIEEVPHLDAARPFLNDFNSN